MFPSGSRTYAKHSVPAPSALHHRRARLLHVVHRERDVRVPHAVRHRLALRDDLVVGEDLERRSFRAAPRQPQVHAAQPRTCEARPRLEPLAAHVALRRHALAREHALVERGEPRPVACDDVRVPVSSTVRSGNAIVRSTRRA
jgi:hypothetical protein